MDSGACWLCEIRNNREEAKKKYTADSLMERISCNNLLRSYIRAYPLDPGETLTRTTRRVTYFGPEGPIPPQTAEIGEIRIANKLPSWYPEGDFNNLGPGKSHTQFIDKIEYSGPKGDTLDFLIGVLSGASREVLSAGSFPIRDGVIVSEEHCPVCNSLFSTHKSL